MKISRRFGSLIIGIALLFIMIFTFPNSMMQLFIVLVMAILLIIGIVGIYQPIREAEKFLEENKLDFYQTENPLLIQLMSCLEETENNIRDTYTANVLDKQAQIGNLQSQINPHFLYNTLECIRGEALLEGYDSIASMAQALASFFRYSISQKENIVKLQDELINIKNYFLIQSYRFENKFNLRILIEDDEDELLDCYLPKLTIQPIVENAIFHGLETKAGKGNVTIRLYSTEKRFVILISDDGIGMNEEELQVLKNKLEQIGIEPESTNNDGTGIALNNVNQRIKILFGQEYGIQLYSTKNNGTDVEIVIPIVKDKKKLV